jgi:hypothetical protein
VTGGATEFVAGASVDPVQVALRITEINYHPVDNTVLPGTGLDKNDYEFIELKNFGSVTINLQNVEFTAGISVVLGDVSLAPGELGVVVKNISAFESRYGTGIKILGVFPNSLDNAGEQIVLENADGSILWDFTYDDTGAGWHPSTDGNGPSLVVINPVSNPNLSDGASYRPSYYVGGSPGIDETFVNVTGRHVFYNQSVFDGNSQAAGAADDAAIAADKSALLPGGAATFDHYTSYSRGLNGIMVDLGGVNGVTLTAADMIFRVGNNDDPSGWSAAPAPLTVVNRSMVGGYVRVEIVWENNVIENQWLQVTLKGGLGSTSGLAADDVFYFGNAIGETGDAAANAQVNAADEIGARYYAADLTGLPVAQAVVNAYDFNRDGQVNASDEAIAGSGYTNFMNALKLIAPPGSLEAMLVVNLPAPLTAPAVAGGPAPALVAVPASESKPDLPPPAPAPLPTSGDVTAPAADPIAPVVLVTELPGDSAQKTDQTQRKRHQAFVTRTLKTLRAHVNGLKNASWRSPLK